MPGAHTEFAFESAIEHHLLSAGGYVRGDADAFDRALCLDVSTLLAFVRDSQPKEWAQLERFRPGQAAEALVEDLCRALNSRHEGCLKVLRHGFKCMGMLFRAAYFAPASGLNSETARLYAANRLTVARQVRYSPEHENAIDLVLGVNGIPVATAELKNPMTGQTWHHAVEQYRRDRSPQDLLFHFNRRTLVHFAVDPDEVHMATCLAGNSTRFLPFNRGDRGGAGNPENPGGCRTAYLWEEVWQRDSFLDILGRFLHVEKEEAAGRKSKGRTIVFPRYHQLEAVRRLVSEARREGAGHNYLVQHSAGSGKSNSIAWLAHRLSSLYDERDRKVFDSVVVVTDRRVLDQQLQDTIYQFEHRQGVVRKIDESSAQLAEALAAGAPIVVTTLQKFPFVAERIGALPKRRYAVILDEAHSSQSGEAATEMKGILAEAVIREDAKQYAADEGLPDSEDILRAMAKRGQQPNLSFFAFTATPKYKTLKVFGRADGEGVKPFHLYGMRQAIEEGFILDVLRHYTTYATYYRLEQEAAEDREVDKRKAGRALARFMTLHPHNIAQKTEVMIEHFRRFTRHRIGGTAKAMVVTSSRLHAVRYKQAFDRYVAENGYGDIRTLAAFSGSVPDPDVPDVQYTEQGMNQGIPESQLPERFASPEYQILVVAEKYQTGFDQPLLHTIYVDKRLDGIQAVQTLSRLNRTCPGKEDTFVLDFVNDAGEIRKAFQPYYEATAMGEDAKPSQLYELQARLDEFRVYEKAEVEEFCRAFYRPRQKQTVSDHAKMNACLDPAVLRYLEMEKEKREEFRKALVAYRNLYAFLAQVIPFRDADLERLYAYARFLLGKIPMRDLGPKYRFDDDVSLRFYRLQMISEGTISLEGGAGGAVSGPVSVGTGAEQEQKIGLSKLIDILNERFGTDFQPADQLFFDSIREEAMAKENIRQAARANSLENFGYVFFRELQDLFLKRMEQNEDIAARFIDEEDFRSLVGEVLLREVYEKIRKGAAS